MTVDDPNAIVHFDYRVVHDTGIGPDDERWHTFRSAEVYYNKVGKPVAWCYAEPFGDTLDDLRSDLGRMLDATRIPGRSTLERSGLPAEAA